MEGDAWAALCSFAAVLRWTGLPHSRWRDDVFIRCKNGSPVLFAGAPRSNRELLCITRGCRWPHLSRVGPGEIDRCESGRRQTRDFASGQLWRTYSRDPGAGRRSTLFANTKETVRFLSLSVYLRFEEKEAVALGPRSVSTICKNLLMPSVKWFGSETGSL